MVAYAMASSLRLNGLASHATGKRGTAVKASRATCPWAGGLGRRRAAVASKPTAHTSRPGQLVTSGTGALPAELAVMLGCQGLPTLGVLCLGFGTLAYLTWQLADKRRSLRSLPAALTPQGGGGGGAAHGSQRMPADEDESPPQADEMEFDRREVEANAEQVFFTGLICVNAAVYALFYLVSPTRAAAELGALAAWAAKSRVTPILLLMWLWSTGKAFAALAGARAERLAKQRK